MKKLFLSLSLIAPQAAFAATDQGVKGLIIDAHSIINILIGLVASCALLFFIWGLARFILHVGGDESAVEEGRNFMKWGLIGLFVMVSIWGIVNFLVDASGLNPGGVGPSRLPGQSVNDTINGGDTSGSVSPLRHIDNIAVVCGRGLSTNGVCIALSAHDRIGGYGFGFFL